MVPCAYAAHGNVATAKAATARNFIFMIPLLYFLSPKAKRFETPQVP